MPDKQARELVTAAIRQAGTTDLSKVAEELEKLAGQCIRTSSRGLTLGERRQAFLNYLGIGKMSDLKRMIEIVSNERKVV